MSGVHDGRIYYALKNRGTGACFWIWYIHASRGSGTRLKIESEPPES